MEKLAPECSIPLVSFTHAPSEWHFETLTSSTSFGNTVIEDKAKFRGGSDLKQCGIISRCPGSLISGII